MISMTDRWEPYANCPICGGDIWYNWEWDKYRFRRNGWIPECECMLPICQKCGKLADNGKLIDGQWICKTCLDKINKECYMEINIEQILAELKNSTKIEKNFSISIKLEYFKHPILGDATYLKFVINDGLMNFSGRTLEEAFQNYSEFDNDFGKHFDQETEAKGFQIENNELLYTAFDQACESLVEAKAKRQMKLAV